MGTRTKELNRMNNKHHNLLNTENKTAMTDIVCYLRGASISEYSQEIIRQDLLEIVLTAQNRGETIQTVIGEDYQAFCDKVIASLPPKTFKEKFLDLLDTVLLCVSSLSAINLIISKDVINLIRSMASGEPLNFQISFSVFSLLSYVFSIAAAFIIVQLISKNTFKADFKSPKSLLKAFLTGGAIMVLLIAFAWLGRNMLFSVNLFAGLAFALILYIAHILLSKKIKDN